MAEWQPAATMPKEGPFLAWNAKRGCVMQVDRFGADVPGFKSAVVEPYSGILFHPKWWMPFEPPS